MQRRRIKPPRRIAPTIEPITIPAIAPPESPLSEVPALAALVLEAARVEDDVDVEVAVLVLKSTPVIVGNTTPAQRVSAPEL